METIKRYGIKMGDLGGDAAVRSSGVVSGRGVPKRFLETPGRLWMRRMVRVMGLFSFVVTVLTVVSAFVCAFLPSIANDEMAGATMGMVFCLFFVNHMGLFMEMAGDSGGRNWFARGAGLMWGSLFGTFLVAILVRVFSSLF